MSFDFFILGISILTPVIFLFALMFSFKYSTMLFVLRILSYSGLANVILITIAKEMAPRFGLIDAAATWHAVITSFSTVNQNFINERKIFLDALMSKNEQRNEK